MSNDSAERRPRLASTDIVLRLESDDMERLQQRKVDMESHPLLRSLSVGLSLDQVALAVFREGLSSQGAPRAPYPASQPMPAETRAQPEGASQPKRAYPGLPGDLSAEAREELSRRSVEPTDFSELPGSTTAMWDGSERDVYYKNAGWSKRTVQRYVGGAPGRDGSSAELVYFWHGAEGPRDLDLFAGNMQVQRLGSRGVAHMPLPAGAKTRP